MVAIHNTGSGSWLSASTWNTGTIPTAGVNVDVGLKSGPHDTVVELDGTGAAANLHVFDQLNLVNGTLGVGGTGNAAGHVLVSGTIDLDAASKMTAGELRIVGDGLVQDDGLIVLRGLASERAPALNNFGGTMIVSGTLQDFNGFLNHENGLFDTIGGRAEFSPSSLPNGAAAVNQGKIEALDGGLIQFNGALLGHGSLFVDRGEIDIFGSAADKGGAHLVGEASILKLLGGGPLNVEFAGINDELFLGRSLQYKGSIAGFAKGDKIDVLDQAFNASLDAYHPKSHTLEVGSTTIKIVGTYTASDFTFASDTHGGTLIGHV